MRFEEQPDYLYLQNIFHKLYQRECKNNANRINWYQFISSDENYKQFFGSRSIIDNDASRYYCNSKYVHNVNQMNYNIINKFKNKLDKHDTFTNQRTHLCCCGLKNRTGKLIEYLEISPKSGVPSQPQTRENFSGLIVFYKLNEERIFGEVLMLNAKQSVAIKQIYFKSSNNKKILFGQVHGGIYCHYFGKNYHSHHNKGKLTNIIAARGLGYIDGQFVFNSLSFNLDQDKDKFLDKKYRILRVNHVLQVQMPLLLFDLLDFYYKQVILKDNKSL